MKRLARFFCEPSKSQNEKIKFIVIKTDDGRIKGKLVFYCKMLHVSRQAFYNYLNRKDRSWKYQHIVDEMFVILQEDTCNDTYGKYRMHKALEPSSHENNKSFKLPSNVPFTEL